MEYFNRFPEFHVREGERILNAFKRLARQEQWNDGRRRKEKLLFLDNMVQTLNDRLSKLEHFQALCETIFPDRDLPLSLTKCRELLKSVYINIWDLIDDKHQCFNSYDAFRRYTLKRTFPRDHAKKLHVNVFLREVC